MVRSLVVGVMLVGMAGCHAGTSAEKFAPANGPRGIWAELHLGRASIEGELLEVQDSALLLLRANEVVLVPLGEIRAGEFRQRGILIHRGEFIGRESAAELRLVSRYPTGLTPELRARLLAALGQAEPARVAP